MEVEKALAVGQLVDLDYLEAHVVGTTSMAFVGTPHIFPGELDASNVPITGGVCNSVTFSVRVSVPRISDVSCHVQKFLQRRL